MGVFDKAKRKVNELKALKKLATDLEKLGPLPPFNANKNNAIYEYAIKYFNIITSFQDKNPIVMDDFSKQKKKITEIVAHISNSGRQEYGWVRAPKGKPVTSLNLYLGNVYGIWTNTAEFFMGTKDPDVQAIIYNQLAGFIKSHYEPLIKNINELVDKESEKPMMKVTSKLMSGGRRR